MVKFDFYFKPQCPFCVKVIKFMNEENKKNLKEHGGKVQVPFIIKEDGTGMYESDDIIEYLKSNV